MQLHFETSKAPSPERLFIKTDHARARLSQRSIPHELAAIAAEIGEWGNGDRIHLNRKAAQAEMERCRRLATAADTPEKARGFWRRFRLLARAAGRGGITLVVCGETLLTVYGIKA